MKFSADTPSAEDASAARFMIQRHSCLAAMAASLWASDPTYEPPVPEERPLASRSEVNPVPSEWLLQFWHRAEQDRREAVWNALPDDVLEHLQEQQTLVENSELAFLGDIATGGARTRAERLAAIRLLGGIAEDGFARKDKVRAHLVQLLVAKDPGVRTAVAEALWQAQDRLAVPALRDALEQEQHPHTRRTLEHVLRVLG